MDIYPLWNQNLMCMSNTHELRLKQDYPLFISIFNHSAFDVRIDKDMPIATIYMTTHEMEHRSPKRLNQPSHFQSQRLDGISAIVYPGNCGCAQPSCVTIETSGAFLSRYGAPHMSNKNVHYPNTPAIHVYKHIPPANVYEQLIPIPHHDEEAKDDDLPHMPDY